MKRFLPLLIILPLLFWPGCDEENEGTVVFTATFNEEFVSGRNAFIFISDNDGNILAEKTFQGDGSFDLIADISSEEIPDRINVTTIGYDFNLTIHGNSRPEITTNMGVLTGSNWTWVNPYKDYNQESIGVSNYTFANIPDGLENVILSTEGSYYKHRNINYEGNYWLSLDENNVNVLAMGLLNDGTAIYKIIENVSVGETHELDLSEFLQAEQRIINNLTGEDCHYNNIQGFLEDGDHLRFEGYQLVHGNNDGTNWDEDYNFIANYPPNLFSKFQVGITVGQYNTPGEKDWYQKTFGDIPESVEKINADITGINFHVDNFEVDISGTYDQWELSLNDTTSVNYGWRLYIAPSITSGSLPNFPQSVYNEFPDLNRDGFSLYKVGLADFLCAENMDEWLDMFFNYDGYYGDICSGVRWLTYLVE